jgi:ABC-type branched-subunit amino acid transport system substrate-binding protein
VVLALTVGACGLQRPHDEVVAAARLSAPLITDPGPSAALPAPDAMPAAEGTAGRGPMVDTVTGPSATSASPSASGRKPAAGTVPTGIPNTRNVQPSAAPPPAAGRAQPNPAVPPPAPSAGTKAPIVIGSVGTLSGPAGALLKEAVQGVQVWVQWINGRRGLDGHRVEYHVADDGADPARHRALVQELVEKRGVIAFVYNPEVFIGPSAAEYPTRNRIPVVNTEGGHNYVYDSPMYFPVVPAGDELAFGMVAAFSEVAFPQNKRKLAVIACGDLPNCEAFRRVWTGDRTKRLGFQPVYEAKPSLVQPDFTSECLGARQAGAEVIAIAMDNNSVARIAASCHRQSYRPIIGLSDNVALPNIRKDPELDGAVVGTHTFAWPATDSPGSKEFHDVFAQVLPGGELSGALAVGWTTAKAFEAALRAVPIPAQPTSATVLEGLWALNGTDLGGLTHPLRFERDQPAHRKSCWGVVVVKEQQWTAPNGGGVKCAS